MKNIDKYCKNKIQKSESIFKIEIKMLWSIFFN
jgi:hypothetical protein